MDGPFQSNHEMVMYKHNVLNPIAEANRLALAGAPIDEKFTLRRRCDDGTWEQYHNTECHWFPCDDPTNDDAPVE